MKGDRRDDGYLERRLKILTAAIGARNRTPPKCKMCRPAIGREFSVSRRPTITPPTEPQLPVRGEDPPTTDRADSRLFLGPDGVRPIWRLVAAVAFYVVLIFAIEALLAIDPAIWAWMRSQSWALLTPGLLLFEESIRVAAALATATWMRRLENRSFADYGLPSWQAFGKKFWQGVGYGFALLSLLIGLIAAFHGFSLGRVALDPAAAVRYALLYALAFLLVGFFEEATFRGYLQATLAEEIGFWPAAIVLAFGFGLLHIRNPGEATAGLLLAGCFGLLAAFSLRRTGAIWFAIGMHAAWDWGETFFYGVPDSGAAAVGHWTTASLHGPAWLTGGSVGPEGSALVFVVMAAGAVGLHFLFPAARRNR